MSEKIGICFSYAVITIIWLKIVNLIFYCRKNVSNNGINSNLIVFRKYLHYFCIIACNFCKNVVIYVKR